MIHRFKCRETGLILQGQQSRRFPPDIQTTARRKLVILDAASDLSDLCAPPGNRLERLKPPRDNEHSIRLNNQWRICFIWDNGAFGVQIEDYHK